MAFLHPQRGETIFKYKGKKIRANDKDLVYNTALTGLSFVFLLVMLSFHLSSIIVVDWQTFTINSLIHQLHRPYFWGSVITALFVCLLTGTLYYRYRIDSVKQLQHRQKLALMILQNGWYEAEQMQNDGFFKDLPQSKNKEKITHFPKMYYLLKDGLLHINVEITMGKYQEPLLQLENKLETGLFCELVDKELKESYIEYTLLYDTINSRIGIDQVVAINGHLKLMENVFWAYDSLPHMLIAGGTGSGKSYFILTIIEALVQTDSKLYILDPKNSDLADLASVMENVYYRKEDMLACINQFYEEMLARSDEMKNHPNYKTGENYAYLGLPASFLIFDEYVAFMGASRFPISI